MLTKDRLVFDVTDLTTSDQIASFLYASDGTALTHTAGALNVSGTFMAGNEYAEDAAHTSGDTGGFILAVRNDANVSLVDADGDYAPLQVNSTGALKVEGQFMAGNEYAEDSAHTTGDTGGFLLAVRNDAGGSISDTDGDYTGLTTDGSGRLWSNSFISGQAADLTIADGGNSITVDDGGVALQVSDGGGSLTVDGSVAISDLVADDAADAGGSLKVGMRTFDGALTAISAAGDRADMLSDMFRRQFVNDAPNVGAGYGALSVTTTAAEILASPQTGRIKMMLQNLGNKDVYLGFDGSVTSSNGLRLSKGATLEIPFGEDLDIFAISDSGTQDIRYWELA